MIIKNHASSNNKLTKLFLVSIIAILFVLSNPYSSHAANIGVTVDGVPVSFDSSTGYPFLDKNNRTLVPLRAAMEACGCTVDWDDVYKVATVTKGKDVVKVAVGQNYIHRNNQKIENDSAAVVINGRTYLPIRAVLESFYFGVTWDESSSSVGVNTTPDFSSGTKPAGYDEFWSNFEVERKVVDMDGINGIGSIQSAEFSCKYRLADADNENLINYIYSLGDDKISDYVKYFYADNFTVEDDRWNVSFTTGNRFEWVIIVTGYDPTDPTWETSKCDITYK